MQAYSRRNLNIILVITFMAQIAFCLFVAIAGGVKAVPAPVLGLCQIIPGLIVLLFASSYRKRLAKLLRVFAVKWSVALGVVAAITVILCAAMVYLSGNNIPGELAGQIVQYPMYEMLPAALRAVPQYFIYLALMAPLVHLLNATGEEIMWRGYLLDVFLDRMAPKTALVATGLVWGLWHVPMVVILNWVFPGLPLWGSLLFTLSLTAWGILMAWARLRTESLWPPIIMHAVFNAFIIGLYDLVAIPAANPLTSPWGLVGLIVVVPVSLWIFFSRNSLPESVMSQSPVYGVM